MSELTANSDGVRTYRGDSVEALLPRIRAELGPDAVILRRREGLVGGIGGFFQRRCVEVDARPASAGLDVYDEEPEEPPAGGGDAEPAPLRNDAATREGLSTPALRKLVDQAQPFAEMLGELGEEPADGDPEPDAGAEPDPERPEATEPPRAAALREGMAAAGLGEDLAREVVDSVLASLMPFATPRRLRTLVRDELALRLPVAPAAAPGPRTIALVGPAGAGKSTAAAAIAAAHEAAGDEVTRLDLGAPEQPQPGGGLTVIDTPALWSGAARLGEIAAALGSLAPDEVHLVLRAGTAAAACAELVEGLAPLGPDRILLSGAGETAHLGGVLDAAIRGGLPLGYVAEGPRSIAPADARALASRVVP